MKPLHVVQVSFHSDAAKRDPEELLEAWPTLTEVAGAVQRAGVRMAFVQAAHVTRSIRCGETDFHFAPPEQVVERATAECADVIHVHGFHHVRSVGRLMRARRETPVLIQDHGSLPPTGWRAHAWRWALRTTSGVAFTAREQAAPFVESRTLAGHVPVFEVLGGSSAFTPGNQPEARAATGIHGDPCLLWTGRLDENKDPLTMLRAVELAAGQLPGLTLWCCFGKAPLLDAVAGYISASTNLRDRVTLLGTQPRHAMEALHRSADIYVQTSHREASGFSLLEAMACGTPAVATDIPAARRIVGDVGLLAPCGDADAIAAAIVRLANGNRAERRRAVRARFERSLSFDAVGAELCAAYRTLAG